MLFRARVPLVQLRLLVLFLAFVVSCDEVERHEALTFFFDGVPPIEGEEELEQGPAKLISQNLVQRDQEAVWYIHEPMKDCTLCHGQRMQKGFSRQTQLTPPVPELCYNCHTNDADSTAFVHGPVAVGQCLVCHNPHKSKIKHLLTEPIPDLCYLCHNSEVVKSIPNHSTESASECTNCHTAHQSSTRYLLKPGFSQANLKLYTTKVSSEVMQDSIQVGKEEHEKVLQVIQEYQKYLTEADRKKLERFIIDMRTSDSEGSLVKVFWMAGRLIEKGESQKAKAFLKEFKDSSAFSAEERVKIVQVLDLMDRIEARREKLHQMNSDAETKFKQPAAESIKTMDLQNEKKRKIAELYFHSIELYRSGQLEKAREGFVKVLESGLIPAPMVRTIEGYLVQIDNTLAQRTK